MIAVLFCLPARRILFAAEIFFPSAIPGSPALVAFILSGWSGGLTVLAAILFVSRGPLWAWLRFLPRSRLAACRTFLFLLEYGKRGHG